MKGNLLILLTLLISFASFGQDISKQNALKRQIEEEISQIDKQISTTKSKQKRSLNTLSLTKKKIENRKRLLKELDKEITMFSKEINIKNNEIGKLQKRLDTLEIYYEKLILNTYKNRDSKIWFMYIIASEDLSQGLRRWSYLKNISHSVKVQASQIRKTKEEITAEREKLDRLRLSSLNTQKEREKEYKQLSSEEKQLSASIQSLKKQERRYRAQLTEKKKQVEKLNKEIERILAQAMKEQKSSKANDKIDYTLSAKFGDNRGKLPKPVTNGVVVEKFGQSYHPVFKNVKLPFNNGIDISTSSGSQALSVFDGVVKQILVMPGYNQCVLVQHGEYFTFYCKLKKVVVKSGQSIKTSDTIGIIDDSDDGNAILHFQLWKGTEKQNPETWLRAF